MTVKEFLEGKTLSAVEVVNDVILNLVVEDAVYGISVDTSNIPSGLSLTRKTDFTFDNNILKVNGIELDTTTTNMLGEF